MLPPRPPPTQAQLRQEQRVAMIMLDTVDFPRSSLVRSAPASCRFCSTRCCPTEQYAYVLKDCRARVAVRQSELLSVVEPILARLADLEHVVIVAAPSGARSRRSRTRSGVPTHLRPRRPMPTSRVLALFVGLDRHAKGVRHVHTSRCKRRSSMARRCSAYRGRHLLLRRETVLRLRSRQRADIPDVGRRHRGAAAGRPTPASDLRGVEARPADAVLRRADAIRRDPR